MAKKKSKNSRLIVSIVVLALAVLTICTLFMPVFTKTWDLLTKTTSAHFKGKDIISALFNGETASDLSSATNELIILKKSDDAGFVTNLFIWTYALTILVACASAVFALLSMLGMRFKLLNSLLGVALVVLALVALICSFVVAKKFVDFNIEHLTKLKTTVAIGMYLFIATIICGATEVYLARS